MNVKHYIQSVNMCNYLIMCIDSDKLQVLPVNELYKMSNSYTCHRIVTFIYVNLTVLALNALRIMINHTIDLN